MQTVHNPIQTLYCTLYTTQTSSGVANHSLGIPGNLKLGGSLRYCSVHCAEWSLQCAVIWCSVH